MILNSSFSTVEYRCSVSDSVREAYAIGLSDPIFPCERTAPIAKSEASVVSIKGFSKSGYSNIGAFVNISLHFSNDSMKSGDSKLTLLPFFKHFVNGFVSLAKS